MQLQISRDPFLSLTPSQAEKQEPTPHTKFSLKLPTFKTALLDLQFSSKKKEKEEWPLDYNGGECFDPIILSIIFFFFATDLLEIYLFYTINYCHYYLGIFA